MKQIISLLISFAPWIAFLVLSGHTLNQLRIALCVATVLMIVMAITRLHRGAILYSGYLFFSFALIFVVWLENMWVIERLGIIANGTLYATTVLTMIIGKPFTADYAKAEVPENRWNTAGFIKSCYITTCVWSTIFVLNLFAAIALFYDKELAKSSVELFNYSILISGVLFTNIYTRVKKKRAAEISATPDKL